MVQIKTVGVLGSAVLPATVKSASIDYDDVDSLIKSFKGLDAVVAVTPGHLAELHFKPIEAAMRAGVYRFIPSEYGVDIRNLRVREMPFMKTKQRIEKLLIDSAKEGKLTYTAIYGGGFVEWVLTYEELMPIKQRRFNIQNEGNVPFSITKMNDYAKAVVGALSNPKQTENVVMLIESFRTTQLRILELAKEEVPGEWQVDYVDMNKNAEIAEQKMYAGQFDIPVVDPMVFKIMFTPGCGGQIDGTHNDLAGVVPMTDGELRNIIKSLS